jgi:ATP-dependent DNA helicase RecQ
MALTLLPLSIRLRSAARRHFGWRRLRTGQLAAMRAVLKRRDALVVLPTGHGKSAVYQVPATLLPGPTVVISPLLALQQDQIAGLTGRGDPRLAAVRVSSAETPAQRRAAMDALRSGTARFLFITPEQLGQPDRLAEVTALRPSLVAVDEAHCISAWGHDFRPDYLQLGHLVRELGRPPVVALTATASPPVREDITARLGLHAPRLVVTGLDRPNLYLEAVGCVTEEDRWKRLLARLLADEPPGIVYAPTRRVAEDLADRLVGEGIKAQAYHGGMAAGERTRRHEAFLSDEVPVMVATSAFGMGIDKPNVRWIVHVALPDSPDSYLQEIGRAGRDGAPARALLLHRTEDMALQRFFVGAPPERAELTRLARALRDGPVRKSDLAQDLGLGTRRLGQDLALLERVGAAEIVQNGRVTAPRYAPTPDEAVSLALREARRQQTVQRSRTDMMRQFAEGRGCRGQYLLAYFGEHLPQHCGHCDNCDRGSVPRPRRSPDDVPYPVHSTVHHAEWGSGMVLRYEQDRMIVLFDEVGYKTLSVPVVLRQHLLTQG